MDIKTIIKEKGFTLEKVGALMEPPITKGTLSSTIKNNPTVSTLRKIADVIGCNVADFFKDETSNNGAFSCPHCGKKLNIRIEAEPK